jgi:hypothetical protein
MEVHSFCLAIFAGSPLPAADAVKAGDGAEWRRRVTERDNCRRFVRLPLRTRACGLRLGVDATWGAAETAVYSVHVY